MAQFLNKALQLAPNRLLYLQKRFRSKINIQKPRKLYYYRGVVEKFLTPFYEHRYKDKTHVEVCFNTQAQKQLKEPGPYEKIIAREVRNWFENSNMVAFLHKNSMTMEDEFELRVALKKENMYFKSYGYGIMQQVLSDPYYAALRPLVTGHYGIIFSPDKNVAALEKIIKKCPFVILMAGILEGKLLNLDDFLKYGKMDITMAQAGLVQALQSAAGNNLIQQLTQHQSTFVSRLKQIGSNETASDENNKSASV